MEGRVTGWEESKGCPIRRRMRDRIPTVSTPINSNGFEFEELWGGDTPGEEEGGEEGARLGEEDGEEMEVRWVIS